MKTSFNRETEKAANNSPLPSSRIPVFQNEAKCSTFLLVKMSFICMRVKNHFHIKG